MDVTQYSNQMLKNLSQDSLLANLDSGRTYPVIARLVKYSAEQAMDPQQWPDMGTMQAFTRHLLIANGGTSKLLHYFEVTRRSNPNRANFSEISDLWKEFEQYRESEVSPHNKAYLELLRDGQSVVPGALVAIPEVAAGKPWQTNSFTNLVQLPSTDNKQSLRVGYDREDTPPYMVLASLQMCGYELHETLQRRIATFAHSYNKTGNDFYADATRMTQFVKYAPMTLDVAHIEQFISENQHRFLNERELDSM